MIIDTTGIPLIPSHDGKDCPGNGKQKDHFGEPIPCCCDECDYFLYCFQSYSKNVANKKNSSSRYSG